MESLSDEEYSKLPFKRKKEKKINRRKSSVFYSKIIGLQVGENVVIKTEEWKGCRTPKRICTYITKKFPQVKYKCLELADESGWGIKREE
jgi:hypothetical protein